MRSLRRPHPDLTGPGPLFAASVLMSLVTALLCALLPAGLPSSSPVGSAFSPSTTIVSLNGPSSRAAIRRVVEDEGDDATLPVSAGQPVLLAAVADFVAPFATPALLPSGDTAPSLPAVTATGFNARAPPAA